MKRGKMDRKSGFGKALAFLREGKEMTRAGLAEASGVPLWAVAEYERGESTPDRPTLTRLLAALGSTPAELAGLLSWLGEAEDPALAGNGLTRALEVLVAGRLTPRLRLARSVRPAPAVPSSSDENPAAAASRAWELLASWPLAEQLALVEDVEAIRDLALYDAIRSESERCAADSPRARELAILAATVAELVPGAGAYREPGA